MLSSLQVRKVFTTLADIAAKTEDQDLSQRVQIYAQQAAARKTQAEMETTAPDFKSVPVKTLGLRRKVAHAAGFEAPAADEFVEDMSTYKLQDGQLATLMVEARKAGVSGTMLRDLGILNGAVVNLSELAESARGNEAGGPGQK